MTPEMTLPRPKLIYAIYGAVFGICFPLIILIQNFPVDLLTPQKISEINEGFFVMLGGFIVWSLWCLISGAMVGLLTGLLIERMTKNRKINAIVMSGIGALVWAIFMAILALGIPALLVLVIVALIGQNGFAAMFVLAIGILALFGAIVFLIPFSVISFMLSTIISRQMAKRLQIKTYHFFLAAGAIAAIFSFLAVVLKVIATIF